MNEGRKQESNDAQGRPKTASPKSRTFDRDDLASGGLSTSSKDPTSPASSPNTKPANHPPHGEKPEVTGTSPHLRLAIQTQPSRTSRLPEKTPSEIPMTTEEKLAKTSPWQEGYSSHASVARNRSLELESPPDIEKQSLGQPCPSPDRFNLANAHDNPEIVEIDGDDTAEDDDPMRHAMKILVFLSTLAPALSLATCLYTIIASLIILILSPFCLCTTSNQIRRNFQRFLIPPLILQLRAIYSDFDDEGISRNSKPVMLVLINVLAPIYAIGICMAAWVAAGFWFFAAILGDPNIKDTTERGKDNDGKTAVMTVRCWWERWLVRGLR